ncbi:hypothetical protein ACBY01_15605 [Sphingomonas sp. ac-8]|uniref:hypothetical protein n=1 Tax=Sphingomonas sp. ac-8 TaxID=3242977 RepID=UPI003A80AB56
MLLFVRHFMSMLWEPAGMTLKIGRPPARNAIACAAILIATACVTTAEGEAEAPFTAGWEHCDTLRGASVCTWIAMAQKGTRVCAVAEDFATNAYQSHRLIGTATGSRVRFTKICGDPGSETDSRCPGQADEGTEKVGWTGYDRSFHLCKGRLFENPQGCEGGDDTSMQPVSSSRLPISEEDRGWLATCTTEALSLQRQK